MFNTLITITIYSLISILVILFASLMGFMIASVPCLTTAIILNLIFALLAITVTPGCKPYLEELA